MLYVNGFESETCSLIWHKKFFVLQTELRTPLFKWDISRPSMIFVAIQTKLNEFFWDTLYLYILDGWKYILAHSAQFSHSRIVETPN